MHFIDIAAESPFTTQSKVFYENVTLKGPLQEFYLNVKERFEISSDHESCVVMSKSPCKSPSRQCGPMGGITQRRIQRTLVQWYCSTVSLCLDLGKPRLLPTVRPKREACWQATGC